MTVNIATSMAGTMTIPIIMIMKAVTTNMAMIMTDITATAIPMIRLR